MLSDSKLQLLNYEHADDLQEVLRVVSKCKQPALIVIENILQLVGSNYTDDNQLLVEIIKVCDNLIMIGLYNPFLQLLMDEVIPA